MSSTRSRAPLWQASASSTWCLTGSMLPFILQTELSSFLMEITTLIFKKKDEDEKTYILDKILDKTGMKGTGQQRGCYLSPNALS